MNKGNLYLIPTPLGETGFEATLPTYNLQILLRIDTFIVEELRTARRFLRKAGYTKDFETVTFHLLNEHTPDNEAVSMLENAISGQYIGLLSEAGLPCIADPGNIVVRLAHQKGIRVIPLTGPSSIMLALMASGLNGQNFVFHGYLPVKPDERTKALRELENAASKGNQTQIFIETPYRNLQMLESIVKTCHASLTLCIAADLTLETEWIRSMPVIEWKRQKPELHKRPAVFLLGNG
ncbi:MAG: SAM-dependent methyltransferase [Lentimicrobiaceae bacterium]|jgi:16S rRNA (cytidine1402-2'-O)-methyltransferase